MFCPSCGAEERKQSQFCRGCGTELHAVRTALVRPDVVTNSATGARDEIGRAIADRIRDIQTAGNLKKIVEDVLPQVEKFLESPEERRLRSVREGVITSATGLGLILLFLLISLVTRQEEVMIASGAGLLVFVIGLGIVINAYFFTVPAKHMEKDSRAITPGRAAPGVIANDSMKKELAPVERPVVASVTEGTTRQLE